ncbi:hypothetical protein ACHZ98_25465 [Streptomyces sp. MAR4 CNY-716]
MGIVLGTATFTQAAAGFFVQGIGSMGIQLQRELGLSTAEPGLLISAAQLVPLLGLLAAGELLDRDNERWVVGVGACVVAGAPGLGSSAPGYGWPLVVLVIVGADRPRTPGPPVAVVLGMAVLMTPAGRSPGVAVVALVWLGFFGFGRYGPWVASVDGTTEA